MRPVSLLLSNIHSFRGEYRLDYPLGPAVLVGPNGSGKSTLAVDALKFALWGTTRGPADSIITEGEKRARAEVIFEENGQRYLVARSRSRAGGGSSSLTFARLDDDVQTVLDGANLAETQARIISLLQLTDDLFSVTSCSPQGQAAAFSQARPAERKAVLAEILGLDAWGRRAEIAGRRLRETEASAKGLQERHASLQQAATALADLLPALEEAQARAGVLADGTVVAEVALAKAQQEQRELEAMLAETRARVADLARIRDELQAATAKRGEARSRLVRLRALAEKRAGLEGELRAAEAAAEDEREWRGRQVQAEALLRQRDILREQMQTARVQHEAKVAGLERDVKRAREQHAAAIAAEEKAIVLLTRQVEPLDRASCAMLTRERLTEEMIAALDGCVRTCPLLAAARQAKPMMLEHQARLEELQQAAPWAEFEAALVQAQGEDPTAAGSEQLELLTRQAAAVGYLEAQHKAAAQLARTVSERQQRLSEAENAAVSALELERVLAELTETMSRLSAEEKEREGDAVQGDFLAQGLREQEATVATNLAQVNALTDERQALQEQIARLQERRMVAQEAEAEAASCAGSLQEAEQRARVLRALGQAFGKAGIPALLIDRAIPELQDEANAVLADLADGRLTLAIRTLREKRSDRQLAETLEIVVADERGERGYESFSGGEAMRVDLALRVGLAKFLARRAGATCALMICDEMAAPLDTEGRSAFVDILAKAANYFATVLCVTHCDDLRDTFPCEIRVYKDAAGSHAEVVTR